MPALSIQCLSISLSVTLVLVTGGIIGGLSITFGNQATDRTKETGEKGLAQTGLVCEEGFRRLDDVAKDGVNQSLDSGQRNAEGLTEALMTQALSTISNQIAAFYDVVGQTGEVFRRTYDTMQPHQWVDRTAFDSTRRGARGLYIEGVKRGLCFLTIHGTGPWVDGVEQQMGFSPNLDTSVRPTADYAAHNAVGPIVFYCDGLNEAQCAAEDCIWCSKPNGQGYCGNPMRKEPGAQTGTPKPCKDGWNTPPGYEVQWYQTSLFPWMVGVYDDQGHIYKGSCGYDTKCGCKALADYRLKKGNDLAIVPRGQYRRPDGTFPEPGTVPKEQLLEAGLCNLPENMVGLTTHRVANQKYPPGIQHWAPMRGFDVSPILAGFTWFTIEVPPYKIWTVAGVDLQLASGYMKDATAALPAESRMYLAQADSWKHYGACKDDFHGMIATVTLTCDLLNVILPALRPGVPVCDIELKALTDFIAREEYVRDHCPEMCGICVDGRFPVSEYDGWLVASSHGKPHRELPANESGMFDTSGMHDILPIRAWESTDPVVAGHSAMVMRDIGSFEQMGKDSKWTDAEGKLWWVKAERIQIGEYQETSLDLTLILLVLRNKAMELIDKATEDTGREISERQAEARVWFSERRAETAEQIRKENEETEKEKEQGFYIMIAVTVVSVSILLAGSVVFVRLIIAPLLVLEREMAEVAVMHLEEVDREREPSKLAEVAAMQASFFQMIVNLIEYRNYMPASVLLDDDEEEEESVVETAKSDNDSKRESKASGVSSRQSRQSSHVSRSTASKSQQMSPRGGARPNVEQQSLTKKPVSFAVITLRGWHTSATKSDLSNAHTEILSAVLSVFVAQKGVPDVFSGDRILCSYNGIKVTRLHKTNAALSALQGSAKAQEVATAAGHSLTTSAACVSGEVFCGNSGCTGMKRFSFFGAPVTWVWGLERVNANLQTRILVDSPIANEVNTKIQVRPIEKVKFAKRWTKDAHTVSELMNEMEAAEDEWMYQLEEGEKNNKYAAWTGFVQAVMTGQFDADAIALLRDQIAIMEKENGAVAIPQILWERYEKAIEGGQHAPLELLFH